MTKIMTQLFIVGLSFALGFAVAGMSGFFSVPTPAKKTPTAKPVAAKTPAPALTPAQQEALKVQKISQPIIRSMQTGLQETDYAAFSRNFQQIMLETIPAEKFNQQAKIIQTSYGELSPATWLGYYQVGTTFITLWKARANNTGSDVLFTLSLVEIAQSWQVVGFHFQ